MSLCLQEGSSKFRVAPHRVKRTPSDKSVQLRFLFLCGLDTHWRPTLADLE